MIRILLIVVQIFWIIIMLVMFLGCKKNAPEDIVIHGNVRNNCTGLGFRDQLVQLSFENQLFERVTDVNGDFDFGLVTVRPKDKTKFKLGVPGFSNKDFELYGLTVILTADEISEFNQFGISASFKRLNIVYPDDYVYNPNDSIDISFHQQILEKFEPKRTVYFRLHGLAETLNVSGFDNYFSGINGYPMGWWQVKLTKYKSGQYSTVYDSVFINMGENKKYVMPW